MVYEWFGWWIADEDDEDDERALASEELVVTKSKLKLDKPQY